MEGSGFKRGVASRQRFPSGGPANPRNRQKLPWRYQARNQGRQPSGGFKCEFPESVRGPMFPAAERDGSGSGGTIPSGTMIRCESGLRPRGRTLCSELGVGVSINQSINRTHPGSLHDGAPINILCTQHLWHLCTHQCARLEGGTPLGVGRKRFHFSWIYVIKATASIRRSLFHSAVKRAIGRFGQRPAWKSCFGR